MRDVLKDIPEDAQERRRRESGRREGGRYQQGAGNGKVMEGYGTEALEMGDFNVGRGPCDETKWERYSGTDIGDTQVGG